jgi:hypothetical protein
LARKCDPHSEIAINTHQSAPDRAACSTSGFIRRNFESAVALAIEKTGNIDAACTIVFGLVIATGQSARQV